jgi:hypothetical protein
MSPSPTTLRLGSLLSLLAALVHLVAPDRLLGTARWGYDRVLAVEFEPRPSATRRVRLVGLGLFAVGVVLAGLAGRLRGADRDSP